MKTFSKVLMGMALAGAAAASPMSVDACSRVLYEGNDSLYIVGRSLDWRTPIPTNIYVYPRGMHKMGSDRPGAVEWTSRYGAVYAVGYDGGITEGMNEKGLVINGLFCKGTVYDNDSTKGRRPMSMAMFVGWLLDMNATTDEVVEVLKKQDFTLGGATFDGGTVSALHWGVTDATGHSVIFEFDHGDIKIYDMDEYKVMTNDPEWPSMTAILAYWGKIGGSHALPGTVTSADRAVRGQYFITHVEKTGDAQLGASICRSVLMDCCVPFTYEIEGQPNLSSTQWRSLSDVRDKLYYFEPVTGYGIYYVDLKRCDLRDGAKVLKLDTSKSTDYAGDVTDKLKKSEPFTPIY